MSTTDGWSKLSFASCVTRKQRSLDALVYIYTFYLYHTRKRKKKERNSGTVRGPRQTGRCKETGLWLGRVWETSETRNRAVQTGLWLGRVWETAERRYLTISLALRDGRGEGGPARGHVHSRLRAIAGRKPRDETRPSGGEIAERRL